MTLTVTVHRGTRAIGGSCIEISAPCGARLILDVGRPLDAPRDATGLLPSTLERQGPATVLISHPHMDHWGLIDELPTHWPVWTGAASAELMRLTAGLFGRVIDRELHNWSSRAEPFNVGPFTITPFLTDHSAFDAYMLLIESAGRRILYTGDFRSHGRKASLVERMIASPPPDIDVLIMEGTNLRSDKPVITESALENDFIALAQETPGHLFVQWSAQNVDRTVTLYRAAKRSGRNLVVDLYGADVLERVAGTSRVPRPGAEFPGLKVVITRSGQRLYARQGRSSWANSMARSRFATSRRRLAGQRAIIMLRDPMLKEFVAGGLGFNPTDAYVFSSWSGYLNPENPATGWAQAHAAGARTEKLHTSGHASAADLARFAAAIAPKALVPVHGVLWDDPDIALPPIRRLADGEAWTLN